jgi:hypothetical protein
VIWTSLLPIDAIRPAKKINPAPSLFALLQTSLLFSLEHYVNIEQRFDSKALAWLLWFVDSTRGVVRVEKYGCEAPARHRWKSVLTALANVMVKGQFARLWMPGTRNFRAPTMAEANCPPRTQNLQSLMKSCAPPQCALL